MFKIKNIPIKKNILFMDYQGLLLGFVVNITIQYLDASMLSMKWVCLQIIFNIKNTTKFEIFWIKLNPNLVLDYFAKNNLININYFLKKKLFSTRFEFTNYFVLKLTIFFYLYFPRFEVTSRFV
jgi:hypothetical protein